VKEDFDPNNTQSGTVRFRTIDPCFASKGGSSGWQGGGGMWKRDQHSPFFFGVLLDPPPYLPNRFHTYVFGDVFLHKETVLGHNSQHMSRLIHINGDP
jgi:hypothetical protein